MPSSPHLRAVVPHLRAVVLGTLAVALAAPAPASALTLTQGPGGPFATGANPSAVAVGRLSSSAGARRALLVVSTSGSSVGVLRNDGFGAFAPATGSAVAVGAFPGAIATGDLDGDGRLDFVTTSASTNTVSVRLGNGAGDFTAAADLTDVAAPGQQPIAIVVADFDGDGNLDLATANSRPTQPADPAPRDPGSVSVLRGHGDGSFAAPVRIAGNGGGTGADTQSPRSLVVADFDGDGKPDLATGNSRRPTSPPRQPRSPSSATTAAAASASIPPGRSPPAARAAAGSRPGISTATASPTSSPPTTAPASSR